MNTYGNVGKPKTNLGKNKNINNTYGNLGESKNVNEQLRDTMDNNYDIS